LFFTAVAVSPSTLCCMSWIMIRQPLLPMQWLVGAPYNLPVVVRHTLENGCSGDVRVSVGPLLCCAARARS
jgi:hypothetical protein